MLKYMYDNYLDDYNWFLRADDDVYVRTKELVDFLSQLDPSEPLYMGQPGLGKPEDRERLKLFPHECYCMGGPGILYSNGLLRRLGPHLEECLQNVVVSYNEDVEVGRCVSRRVGVQCTWSYQVSSGGCSGWMTDPDNGALEVFVQTLSTVQLTQSGVQLQSKYHPASIVYPTANPSHTLDILFVLLPLICHILYSLWTVMNLSQLVVYCHEPVTARSLLS